MVMIPNPEDTIVAVASAPGSGRRGIVRLSGMAVRSVVAAVFAEQPISWPVHRALLRGQVRLPDVYSSLPADLHWAPGPRSYTGQDTAELHIVSSPPLLEALNAAVLNAGARAALPGEFTLRAFLNGKRDLPRAEAVAAVIEANSPDELKQALGQLAGGVTQPLHGLRDDLLNLLADVEAGLDFTDEDIEFVARQDVLLRLSKGLAHLTNLRKQLEGRSVSGRPFRVALVGEPNAGKSSLFNALASLPAAIVSPVPGTTRDYLTRSVPLDDLAIELIDTAGWQEGASSAEKQAQLLGGAQAKSADLLLWCVELGKPSPTETTQGPPVVVIATKADLPTAGASPSGAIVTSARTGQGLAQLKQVIAGHVRAWQRPALAPSLSRCQHHVDAALKHLRTAHNVVLFEEPAELLALELRLALEQIGEMVGAVYTDDLLDRIFSRFCIGK
jgi:tRNA modification GTPase